MHAVRYSPVLSALPEAERRRLLRLSSFARHVPGDHVVIAGEPTHRVPLVADGVLKLVCSDRSGRELIVGLAQVGDLIADAEAVDGRPPLLDAVAATPCSILGLDIEELFAALIAHPQAALALARSAAEKAHGMARNSMDRSRGGTKKRIAARLLDLAEILGRMRGGIIELELPLSRAELGHLAGMCRESASRALMSLRDEGALEFEGRSVKIIRPGLLEQISLEERAAGLFRSRDAEAIPRSPASVGI